MSEIHPRFIAALDAIQATLQIEKPAASEYRDLLWSDLKRYWTLSEESVLHGLNDFRVSNIFKHYPKIGELKPLIDKRLFPDPEEAYHEACNFAGNEAHQWSHPIVRETARQIGSSDLKTGSVNAQKHTKARFDARYIDTREKFIKGIQFNFDKPRIAYSPVSDMAVISEWCKKHGTTEKDTAWRLYYLTKKGLSAQIFRKNLEKKLSQEPWWNEHIKIHGSAPVLPKAPE